MALHIIQSRLAFSQLEKTLQLVQADDVILLTESGCLLSQENSKFAKMFNHYTTYCLSTHAEALGVQVIGNITPCSMETFVDLTESHQQIISW